jgi:hypothetical protein
MTSTRRAAPTCSPRRRPSAVGGVVASINGWIAKENLYTALKAARPLVEEFD